MSFFHSYPPKVILALGEAVSGNLKIREWLMTNGYKELGLFSFAIYNNDQAMKWLMENGYAQLAALVNGAEGNGKAVDWLKVNGFDVLVHMALATDNDETSMAWVVKNLDPELVLLTKKMQFSKNRIEAGNGDFHRFNNS